LADKDGIEAFQIRKDDQLLQRSVVADIPVGVGMGVAPFSGGLAKEGDVGQVGFAGIDERRLLFCDGGGNERLLDGIRVDAVIDLGQGALEVPTELEPVVFLVFEAAEFFDQVNFELRADPRPELKSDVRMGESAAISPRCGLEPNSVGFLDPFFDTDLVAVQTGLTFNYGEFAVINSRIKRG